MIFRITSITTATAIFIIISFFLSFNWNRCRWFGGRPLLFSTRRLIARLSCWLFFFLRLIFLLRRLTLAFILLRRGGSPSICWCLMLDSNSIRSLNKLCWSWSCSSSCTLILHHNILLFLDYFSISLRRILLIDFVLHKNLSHLVQILKGFIHSFLESAELSYKLDKAFGFASFGTTLLTLTLGMTCPCLFFNDILRL